MANLEDILKSNTFKSVAIGLGAAVLAPAVLPALAGLARPFARAAIKAGIVFYEKGRETAAELGELMDDLVAEAKADLHHESMPGVETAEPTPPNPDNTDNG